MSGKLFQYHDFPRHILSGAAHGNVEAGKLGSPGRMMFTAFILGNRGASFDQAMTMEIRFAAEAVRCNSMLGHDDSFGRGPRRIKVVESSNFILASLWAVPFCGCLSDREHRT